MIAVFAISMMLLTAGFAVPALLPEQVKVRVRNR